MRPKRGELIHHHYAKPMSRLALKRLRSLRAGEALAQLPMELQPRMGFRGAYGRLDPDLPAPTITGNFDYVSRGRFSHYDQDRGITFREGARLQSFPDRFRWLGPSYEQIALQIGNAVPPLIANSLAQHVGKLLGVTQDDQPMAAISSELGDAKAVAE
jgi:DNA (cytosine-5)-methyltransferase 1